MFNSLKLISFQFFTSWRKLKWYFNFIYWHRTRNNKANGKEKKNSRKAKKSSIRKRQTYWMTYWIHTHTKNTTHEERKQQHKISLTTRSQKEYLFHFFLLASSSSSIRISMCLRARHTDTWLYSGWVCASMILDIAEGHPVYMCARPLLVGRVQCIHKNEKHHTQSTHRGGSIDANQQIRLHSAHLIVWKSFWYIVIVCLVIHYVANACYWLNDSLARSFCLSFRFGLLAHTRT